MKIEALFISDVHLGSKGSNAEQVLNVLKQYQPNYLFLVGDIIDGWLLKRKFRWPQSHTNVIRKIMSYSKNGTKVIYLPGNHDEFAREYLDLNFGNIEIHNEYIWNNTYITHGDLYDGVVKLKWLGILGSIGYDFAISVDRRLKKLGYKRSLSKFLKDKVKEAVKFITSFEDELCRQSIKHNCKTVICGHIHHPEDKLIGDVRYLNCGDWIENNSYIIYNENEYTVIKG
ncbi:MAG: UDP-2,3-diacylglucosamine diphosphatase [Actinobacteria bacterium]|nr:UDP-2,3-diacylglucosamine diphosphatase [Actinomycetota bacterium]